MGNNIWCSYGVDDPDENYSVFIEWYKRAGASNGPATLMASGSDSNYTPSSANFSTSDWIECRVTITDPSGSVTGSGYAYF